MMISAEAGEGYHSWKARKARDLPQESEGREEGSGSRRDGPSGTLAAERDFFGYGEGYREACEGFGIKVAAKINGDEVRVSSKDKDCLQECIQFLKQQDIPADLQFVNYR